MLAFLDGKIDYIEGNTVALNVGGVGYELMATSSALARFANCEGEIRLYTYMQVSEQGVSLYGFSCREEKAMFLKLISVSGIGSKTASGILSGIKIEKLALAIVTGDASELSRVKGIGKKTAERIILELKEKVSAFVGSEKAAAFVDALPVFANDENEAVEALMALGISRVESLKAVNRAIESGKNKVEEIISYALRNL